MHRAHSSGDFWRRVSFEGLLAVLDVCGSWPGAWLLSMALASVGLWLLAWSGLPRVGDCLGRFWSHDVAHVWGLDEMSLTYGMQGWLAKL